MTILAALWLFLPAGIANMAPVLVNKIPLVNQWNTPMDFNASWRGVRVFGPHKTWRGLLSGVVFASLFAALQYFVYSPYVTSLTQAMLLGGLLGFGALLGDAIASFFKRQRRLPSGAPWVPVDQTDYIVGGLLVSYPLISSWLSIGGFIAIILIYTGLHFLMSYIGYRLGFKSQPI